MPGAIDSAVTVPAMGARTCIGREPLLASIDEDGATGYYSIVTVRCDSGYKSLDDLKGKVLAFADPDSTSGYAVPYFNLVQQGYDPKTYFSAIPFSGSHEFGVQGVETKQYDAAATYENSDVDGIYQRMVQKGMIPEGDICSIWKSPEITNGPLAARTNLPQDLIDAMTQTVIDYPTKDPEAFKKQNGPISPLGTTGLRRPPANSYRRPKAPARHVGSS